MTDKPFDYEEHIRERLEQTKPAPEWDYVGPDMRTAQPTPGAVPCLHENFACSVGVARLVDEDKPLRFMAEVTIMCAQCGQKFMFQGIEAIGHRFHEPCLNISRTELTIPIAPWDGEFATHASYEMPS